VGKIYLSYKALIESFRKSRENDKDEEEETKYQVRTKDDSHEICISLPNKSPNYSIDLILKLV
jgi:hypothetical protein